MPCSSLPQAFNRACDQRLDRRINRLKRCIVFLSLCIDQEYTAQANPVLGAMFEQRLLALAVRLAHPPTKAVAFDGITGLSNSKSHRTLVRWDFPLNIVIEPKAAELHVSTTGKNVPESAVPSKNLVFRNTVADRIIGAWARH